MRKLQLRSWAAQLCSCRVNCTMRMRTAHTVCSKIKNSCQRTCKMSWVLIQVAERKPTFYDPLLVGSWTYANPRVRPTSKQHMLLEKEVVPSWHPHTHCIRYHFIVIAYTMSSYMKSSCACVWYTMGYSEGIGRYISRESKRKIVQRWQPQSKFW